MKQLLLLRHAKSSWTDPNLSDFDRPLNERGIGAAQIMADFLNAEMPKPDVILCSSAQRTRETLAPLLVRYAHSCDIHIMRDLYHASDQAILNAVRNFGKGDTVLVVGHNPGMEDCARLLQGGGDVRALYEKFPTAACAHIVFDVADWGQIKAGEGELRKFTKPRDLAPDDPNG